MTDEGQGFTPGDSAPIFDLFVQLDRRDEPYNGGYGLGIGLALVRQIVELHEGRITATSEGPGRGACFRIQMPILQSPQGPVAEAAGMDQAH